uniref:Uncharacterized protein n=1 Tax=Rhizophora mucronata TaxID=61149 RepID=A0A2P2R1W3_RHIMU
MLVLLPISSFHSRCSCSLSKTISYGLLNLYLILCLNSISVIFLHLYHKFVGLL